jgi:glycosyltransferase involved in cell wall biosynthesis
MEGIIDAVIDGVTGTLVPSAETDAWVRVVSELVADETRLDERSANAAASSRRVYGEDSFSAALLAELRRSD